MRILLLAILIGCATNPKEVVMFSILEDCRNYVEIQCNFDIYSANLHSDACYLLEDVENMLSQYYWGAMGGFSE